MLSFDESIGEVGRADHHRIDHGRLYPAFREHRPDGRGDSAADVGRGWLLGRSNDPAAVDQNGIGVRPAHIDTNSHLMLPPSDLRRRADYTGGRGAAQRLTRVPGRANGYWPGPRRVSAGSGGGSWLELGREACGGGGG